MAIQRFFARRRYRRYKRQLRERIALMIILGFFILNCCLCFGLGLQTSVLQDIGILPTPTPMPEKFEMQQTGFVEISNLIPCCAG